MKNFTNTFPVLIDASPEVVFAYGSDLKAHTDLASWLGPIRKYHRRCEITLTMKVPLLRERNPA